MNYADRYVPSSVKPLYQSELQLTDFQSSLPSVSMIIVFMIFAMIFGTLADKQLIDRRYILCIGVILWSAATSLAGLATNLGWLVGIRSLVGIGEAAYGTIAPAMLSDFYPDNERNVVFGIYYLAIPIGGAIGYVIGAVLGGNYGWRVAFLACGLPGILIGTYALKVNNPVRGINDEIKSSSGTDLNTPNSHTHDTTLIHTHMSPMHTYDRLNLTEIPLSSDVDTPSPTSTRSIARPKHTYKDLKIATYAFISDLGELLQNPTYMSTTMGNAAGNFALGGLADWYMYALITNIVY